MRIANRAVLWVTLGMAGALGRAAAGQTCASATDTASMVLVAEMKSLSAGTDPAAVYNRRDFQIPSVDTSTIVLVQQNQVCQKALAAFNSTMPGASPLPTKIYLAKVGAIYVATYPFSDTHTWPYAVLDSKYKVLSKFSH